MLMSYVVAAFIIAGVICALGIAAFVWLNARDSMLDERTYDKGFDAKRDIHRQYILRSTPEQALIGQGRLRWGRPFPCPQAPEPRGDHPEIRNSGPTDGIKGRSGVLPGTPGNLRHADCSEVNSPGIVNRTRPGSGRLIRGKSRWPTTIIPVPSGSSTRVSRCSSRSFS